MPDVTPVIRDHRKGINQSPVRWANTDARQRSAGTKDVPVPTKDSRHLRRHQRGPFVRAPDQRPIITPVLDVVPAGFKTLPV